MKNSITSKLEIINIQNKKRRIVYEEAGLFEAPNWSRDGNYLIFNRQGQLYKFEFESNTTQLIPSDFAIRNNNDHGLSPDGKHIALSHHSSDTKDQGDSIIYIMPSEGDTPTRITELGPSYWHGWSPDGKSLAYTAGRANNASFNIYAIDIASKVETQLTFTQGLDDGPDYSACGNYIYFNSYRSGMMQIWRIDADGNNPTQIIKSKHSDWFPHPSPDGKYLVFIRYLKDQKEAHPFGQDVQLMLYEIKTNTLIALTDIFYGGQGTINVPSWAPDSNGLAFVSYQQVSEN